MTESANSRHLGILGSHFRANDILVGVVDEQAMATCLWADTLGDGLLEPANPAYQLIRLSDALEFPGVVNGVVPSMREVTH